MVFGYTLWFPKLTYPRLQWTTQKSSMNLVDPARAPARVEIADTRSPTELPQPSQKLLAGSTFLSFDRRHVMLSS